MPNSSRVQSGDAAQMRFRKSRPMHGLAGEWRPTHPAPEVGFGRTLLVFVIGSLAAMACAGRRPALTSPGWPPGIPTSIRRQFDAVISHELADSLTCRLSDVRFELAARPPFYLCEAGDTTGLGPSAMAVLDATAQPLLVAQTWRVTEAEEPDVWAKMIAANDARWGTGLSCAPNESIWLTPTWHIEARLDRFVTPMNGRVYQISYVGRQRSPLKPTVACARRHVSGDSD